MQQGSVAAMSMKTLYVVKMSLAFIVARAIQACTVIIVTTVAENARFWYATTFIARASTVLIMAIVLLVKPAGIFGKKE